MKKKYIIAIFVFVLNSINIFGQVTDNLKKAKYIRVSEAYSYLTGQEYSLNLIRNEFPQFEPDIIRAQMSFNATFGKSKEKMKRFLSEYLGRNEFNKYEEKLMTEMKKLSVNQPFTDEIAADFIAEVESRAKGNIASPVLETLLSFQYFNTSHEELLAGYTTVFKTKGHSKSKNTDWQIKVPKSWRAGEADRPNIIQKFISDYGDGNQGIMLMVKELALPEGYEFSTEELNELFTENAMENMVPEGGKFISFNQMTLDNNIGGMLEIEQTTDHLDFKIKIRMVQFMFIRENKMYTLQGTVSSEKTETDLAIDMQKYLPLYKLVANTIVVNDQYK